jgi:hypothetical protein
VVLQVPPSVHHAAALELEEVALLTRLVRLVEDLVAVVVPVARANVVEDHH